MHKKEIFLSWSFPPQILQANNSCLIEMKEGERESERDGEIKKATDISCKAEPKGTTL